MWNGGDAGAWQTLAFCKNSRWGVMIEHRSGLGIANEPLLITNNCESSEHFTRSSFYAPKSYELCTYSPLYLLRRSFCEVVEFEDLPSIHHNHALTMSLLTPHFETNGCGSFCCRTFSLTILSPGFASASICLFSSGPPGPSKSPALYSLLREQSVSTELIVFRRMEMSLLSSPRVNRSTFALRDISVVSRTRGT